MDREKQDFLNDHLPYELEMLDAAYRDCQVRRDLTDPDQRYQHNAAIEFFWLHARNLIEFYRGTGTGDAKAADFMVGRIQVELDLQKTNGNVRLLDLMNEQISHLKYARKKSEDEKLNEHDRNLIKRHLDRAQKEFIEALKAEASEIWNKPDHVADLTLAASAIPTTRQVQPRSPTMR
jgi:hypothetical protein